MISRRRFLATSAAAALLPSAARAAAAPMPIFDAHVHFSHDAAERFSAGDAVAILEKAGLARALVSSSATPAPARSTPPRRTSSCPACAPTAGAARSAAGSTTRR